MPEIIINGGRKLSGEITVQGAKNSVLPVLAGALLCRGESVVHNCPDISDVDVSMKILSHLGCKCRKQANTVTVRADHLTENDIPDSLMREMRSSVVFLGAILGRMGTAVISNPGGCELGPRPIDIHLSSLNKMGVKIVEEHGLLRCSADKGLKGADISLSFPSVGATENIILAATLARGKTVIHNAAREPEISDLADFLNSAGARIYGSGSDTIEIYGVDSLNSTEHTIIPDRIVAATYMAAAAVTKGEITLNGVMPQHMRSVLSVFSESGCIIEPRGRSITVKCPHRLKRVPTVRSLVYPGFPTDAGPIVIAMLSLSQGTSLFVENIFESRYKYVDELNRFGAKIKTEGKVAVIDGVEKLSATLGKCTDLRGGAAILLAGLASEGETVISEIQHILRGYEDITGNLSHLGADIKLL